MQPDAFTIFVRNGNVDGALRILKKKIQKDGILFELRKKEFYTKPSEQRRQKKAAAIERNRKKQNKMKKHGIKMLIKSIYLFVLSFPSFSKCSSQFEFGIRK